MSKKIIGLSSKIIQVPNMPPHNGDIVSYFKSVERAGGIPIMIPMVKDLNLLEPIIDMLDGIVLTGGSDVHPILYGENPIQELSNVSLARDKFELKILELALEKGIPVLGICRGMQLANVYFNGSLYQDIYKELDDVLGHLSISTVFEGHHKIDIKKDSFLDEIFKGEDILVNSIHHQAIKKLGDGMEVIAKSEDGLIEGVIHNEHKFIGVQFHPEEMINTHPGFLEIYKRALEL